MLVHLLYSAFWGGIGVGASSVVAPMYIAEISPAKIRGRMTAMFQFNVISGILIAYVSNFLLREAGSEPWRWMLGVAGIPAFLFLVLLFLIPESPRFLIKIGKIASAKSILEKIEVVSVDQEIEDIKLSMSQTSVKKTNSLLTSIYKTYICCIPGFYVQPVFPALMQFLYYAPRIFELSGLTNADSMFQSILIGVTNGIFTILGLSLIDRVGRKKLLIVGSLGMSVCLGLVARTFYSQDFSGYGLLIYLLIYIMFFAFSTGAVIWVLIAEIFPNNVRG